MDLFEFVCRAPVNYFRSKPTPYKLDPPKPDLAVVSATSGPEIVRAPISGETQCIERDVDVGGSSKEERAEVRGEKRQISAIAHTGKKSAKRLKREAKDVDDVSTTSRKTAAKSSASDSSTK